MRRGKTTIRTAALAIALVALAGLTAACGGGSGDEDPLARGSAQLAYTLGYMPYAGQVNNTGPLTGIEGELFAAAAKELRITPQPSGVEFPALLAGVQTDRYDIGIGGIGWSAARAKTGIMTDPLYYSPTVVMCKSGITVRQIADLAGKTVGAVTGSQQDIGLRAYKALTARTYPSSQTAFSDLTAGRLDCISIDALTVAYIKKQRPDFKDFNIFPLAPPTPAELAQTPELSTLNPYMVVWYCAPKNEKMCSALNKVIDGWYQTGVTATALKKWGVDDTTSYLTPASVLTDERRGVDRPENWTAPGIEAK